MDSKSPLRRVKGLFWDVQDQRSIFWLAITWNKKKYLQSDGRFHNNLCCFWGTHSLDKVQHCHLLSIRPEKKEFSLERRIFSLNFYVLRLLN